MNHKLILVALLLISAMAVGKDIEFPCPIPIELSVASEKTSTYNLMPCLNNPDGYTWEEFPVNGWPKWISVDKEGNLELKPLKEHIGEYHLNSIATHGGSDFYFFPLVITIE